MKLPGLNSLKTRRFALLSVLLLETMATAWFWHHPPERSAKRAFLTRHEDHYLLAVRNDLNEIDFIRRNTLEEILTVSREEFQLRIGRNSATGATLENVWMTDRRGAYIVFWKNELDERLNQMSFFSSREARFFADAFRSGGYSPSILGHSILLVGSE